jgi:hypothetical protein
MGKNFRMSEKNAASGQRKSQFIEWFPYVLHGMILVSFLSGGGP